MLLSYCVVNTSGRELLLACLEAIERTAPGGRGARAAGARQRLRRRLGRGGRARRSARRPAVRARPAHRQGGERLARCCRRRAGATACSSTRTRSCSRAPSRRCSTRSRRTRGRPPPAPSCSTRDGEPAGRAPGGCPASGRALVGALFLHRRLTRSRAAASSTREVGWVQSSAMLVRREAAEQVGYLDPDFFVYSDETDFCKRLHDAGWRMLFVPGARARSTTTSCHRRAGARRRIVEFHRNRDRYMRKHHSAAAALARALADGLGLPGARAGGDRCCPGTIRAAICLHARQPCGPGAARGSARRPRSTTGAQLTPLNGRRPYHGSAPCCYPLPAGRGAAGYFVGRIRPGGRGTRRLPDLRERARRRLNANVQFPRRRRRRRRPSQSCLRRPRRRSRSRARQLAACTATGCSAPTTCGGRRQARDPPFRPSGDRRPHADGVPAGALEGHAVLRQERRHRDTPSADGHREVAEPQDRQPGRVLAGLDGRARLRHHALGPHHRPERQRRPHPVGARSCRAARRPRRCR